MGSMRLNSNSVRIFSWSCTDGGHESGEHACVCAGCKTGVASSDRNSAASWPAEPPYSAGLQRLLPRRAASSPPAAAQSGTRAASRDAHIESAAT